MFKGKKGKNLKSIALFGSIVIASGTISGVAIGNIYSKKLDKERSTYEAALQAKDNELKRYQLSSKKGFVLKKHLDAGDKITEEDVTMTDLPDFFAPGDMITEKDKVVGKIIKLTSEANTPLTAQMVYEDGPLDPTARRLEVDYVKLPIKLDVKDRIDVMIVFPNGEKYRVLSKKRMEDLDLLNSMMFVNLNIEENYLLTAALVDAYINKAEIMAEQYVEPEMQEEPIKTYMPNVDVLKVMKSDPYVKQDARYAIAEDVRKSLDARLAAMDPNDQHRIGADLPEGSAVSKRKATVGATIVGNGQNSATPTTDGAAAPAGEDPNNGMPAGYQPPPGAEGETKDTGSIGE